MWCIGILKFVINITRKKNDLKTQNDYRKEKQLTCYGELNSDIDKSQAQFTVSQMICKL